MTDLERELDALSVPFARISAPEDMLADPHVQRPGGLVSASLPDGTQIQIPSLPFEYNGRVMSHDTIVPSLGTHRASSDVRAVSVP